MVLLEDLDRAFPKTGVTKSRVSLQQLLNNLDGVGTGEGVIVVATLTNHDSRPGDPPKTWPLRPRCAFPKSEC